MSEPKGHREQPDYVRPTDLIALDHYAAQTGERFADTSAAYRHFRARGQAAGFDPSPFFYSRWYAWQNPDASGFDTCLDHFVAMAQRRLVDPAPFLDSVAFLADRPWYQTIAHALTALTQGKDRSVSPDLAAHLDRLTESQARVHAVIRLSTIKNASTERRRLVWVQAGPRFSTTSWFRPAQPRSWDLMCNWYALEGLDLRHGEIHLRQSGTKATAIHHVLLTAPDLLSRYDQLLFLDDDLAIRHAEIDQVFDAADQNGLAMFQPALLPGSHGVWRDLFRKNDTGVRRTTGVEIMMPGFSRQALLECAPLFSKSISGFGLDFAISEYFRSRGMHCGVIDAVGVRHHELIDEQGGSFYSLMRSLGINQKLELYSAIREIGKFPDFREVLPMRKGG